MGEDGAWNDGVLALQAVDELVHILVGVEAQPVHACIELDVDGPTRDALLLSGMDKCLHQTEGIDLGFQVVVEHGLESCHFRVHDHDVLRDAIATQFYAFVGHGHSQNHRRRP